MAKKPTNEKSITDYSNIRTRNIEFERPEPESNGPISRYQTPYTKVGDMYVTEHGISKKKELHHEHHEFRELTSTEKQVETTTDYAHINTGDVSYKSKEFARNGALSKYTTLGTVAGDMTLTGNGWRTKTEARQEFKEAHKNDAPVKQSHSFEHSKLYDNKVDYEGSQTGYVRKAHLDTEQFNRQVAEFERDFTHIDDSEAAQGSRTLRKDLNQLGIGYKNQHHLTSARISRVMDIVNEAGPCRALENKFLKAEAKSDRALFKEFREMSNLERDNVLKGDGSLLVLKGGYAHTPSKRELALLQLAKEDSDAKSRAQHSDIKKRVNDSFKDYVRDRKPANRADFVKSFGLDKKGNQNFATNTTYLNALKDFTKNIKLIDNKLAKNGVFIGDLSDKQLEKALKTGKLGNHYLTKEDRTLIQERLRLGKAKAAADNARKGRFERTKNTAKTVTKPLEDTDAMQGYQMTKNVVKTTKNTYKAGVTASRNITVGINNARYAGTAAQSTIINRKLKNLTKEQKKIEKLSAKAPTAKNLAKLEKSKAKIRKIGEGETDFLKIQQGLRDKQSPLTERLLKRDSENASLSKGLIRSAWNSKAVTLARNKTKEGVKAGSKAVINEVKNSKTGKFVAGKANKVKAFTSDKANKVKGFTKATFSKLKNSKAGTFTGKLAGKIGAKLGAAKATATMWMFVLKNSKFASAVKFAFKGVGKAFKGVSDVLKGVSDLFNVFRALKKKLIAFAVVAGIITAIFASSGGTFISAGKFLRPFTAEASDDTSADTENEIEQVLLYNRSTNKQGLEYGTGVMQSYLTALMKPESAKYDNPLSAALQGQVNKAILGNSDFSNMQHIMSYSSSTGLLNGYKFSLYKEPYDYSADITVYDEFHEAWTEHTGEYYTVVDEYDEHSRPVKWHEEEVLIYHPSYWDYHTETLTVQGYNGITGNLGSYTSSGTYDKKDSIRNSSQWNNTWTDYSMEFEVYGTGGARITAEDFFKQILIMQLSITELDEESKEFFSQYTAHLMNDILKHAKVNLEVYQIPVSGRSVTFTYTDPKEKGTQYLSVPALKNVVKMRIQIDGCMVPNLLNWDTTNNADVHDPKWNSKYFTPDVTWPGWNNTSKWLPDEYYNTMLYDPETFEEIFGKLTFPNTQKLIPTAFKSTYK